MLADEHNEILRLPRWLLLLPLIAFASCCELAQAQIKLAEVKTQTWVGFENPQVVNGVIVAGVNSKPTLAAVSAKIVLERSQPYKWTEVNVFREMPFGEADILEEVATTGLVTEYRVKTGTAPGSYLVWFRCSGGDFQPANKSMPLIVQAERPVDPLPEPDKPPVPTSDVERIVDNAMLEMRRNYGNAFKRTSEAISSGQLDTDAKLVQFMNPLTKAAREQAVAGIDGLLQDKLPRDGAKLKPEAAGFFRDIANAFERGIK